MNTKIILKLLLSIALLLCLLQMPYWYYQLIRILGMVGFLYFAYLDSKDKIKFTPQLFVVAALILNPIIKIPFGRNTWQIIDIILSVILLLSIFFERILKVTLQESERTAIAMNENDDIKQEPIKRERIISEEEYQQAKERVKKYFNKSEEQ